MPPRSYRNFAEFEREYLKPAFRVGQTFEDMVEDTPFDTEFEFDRDLLAEASDEDDDDL